MVRSTDDLQHSLTDVSQCHARHSDSQVVGDCIESAGRHSWSVPARTIPLAFDLSTVWFVTLHGGDGVRMVD